MSDPLLTEAPPPSNDFDPLSIPSLDPLYLNSQNHHPSSLSDNFDFVDFDFTLDENCDFDFTFDDHYLPSENETFLLPSENPLNGQLGNFASDVDGAVKLSCKASPESGSTAVSGDCGLLDADLYLNCSSSPQNSANRRSSLNSDDDPGGPVLSLGSENSRSGVSSENSNAPSPNSGNLVVDQKIKTEEVSKLAIPKRKKESEEMNNESRSNKYRKSASSAFVNEITDNDPNLSEEESKRKARLMRNRESAQLSRQRKKHHVEELEDKVRNMHSTIADLNSKISFFMAENVSLRQQLCGGNGMPPAPGVYLPPPHMGAPPMPYAWMPCAAPPYMVKPQGSQVPLVPIPRLKPQQASAVAPAKAKNGSKSKSDGSKMKKVASVSFLGLLFFMLLFGGFMPFVDVKYGGVRDGVSRGSFCNTFYNQHRGRVLTVNGHSNVSCQNTGIGFSNGKVGVSGRINCKGGVETNEKDSQPASGPCNASEPLVASLYVPRNDKLVKIDGNLIIHSVLASEKAMASRDASKANKETGLAIPKDFSPALAIPDVRGNGPRHSHTYRNPAEQQRAISSSSAGALKDHMKSCAVNGNLHQWFQEGLAGPLLSSGMCTEVFQFDVSPASSAPGAVIPASPVANMTVEHRQNATQVNRGRNKRRNRRILRHLPVSLTNVTGERKSKKDGFPGNKSASSMVVSVLVDPREAGDGDVDGMIAPKSLSRIFVVVLLDSVKYVTYSCVLPRSGPHLVTT